MTLRRRRPAVPLGAADVAADGALDAPAPVQAAAAKTAAAREQSEAPGGRDRHVSDFLLVAGATHPPWWLGYEPIVDRRHEQAVSETLPVG